MKVNRNEPCSCGSNKKYKHCCGRDNTTPGSSRFKLFIIIGIITFLGFAVYGVVEYYQADHPEMEAYKCDNPNCNQWHYRPIPN